MYIIRLFSYTRNVQIILFREKIIHLEKREGEV